MNALDERSFVKPLARKRKEGIHCRVLEKETGIQKLGITTKSSFIPQVLSVKSTNILSTTLENRLWERSNLVLKQRHAMVYPRR